MDFAILRSFNGFIKARPVLAETMKFPIHGMPCTQKVSNSKHMCCTQTQTQRLAGLSICNSLFCWNTQGLGIGQVVRGLLEAPNTYTISTSGSTSTNSTSSEGAPLTWKHPTNLHWPVSVSCLLSLHSKSSFELFSNERFFTMSWVWVCLTQSMIEMRLTI